MQARAVTVNYVLRLNIRSHVYRSIEVIWGQRASHARMTSNGLVKFRIVNATWR